MEKIEGYLYKKASKNKIPLSGTFELSPVCNFSCKMCYVRKSMAEIHAMGMQLKSWTSWAELAETCKNAGMLYLLLTGGEPFLYPGFRELCEKLSEMGLLIAINTNGTMIDEKTVQWLKQVGPSRMNVTLYGASPETYQRICGDAKGYEKATSAILNLKRAGIPVLINVSMIPENASDMEGIIRFGKENDIPVRISIYMFPPVRRTAQEDDSRFTATEAGDMYLKRLKLQSTKETYVSSIKQIYYDVERLEKSKQQEHTDSYMECRAGRCAFWVSWDGTMTACGITPFPLQVNPFETDFMQCWTELTNTVRTTPVLHGCAGCAKKEICRPCVAMIDAETGTVDCKAPYLCEMSDRILFNIKHELCLKEFEENSENAKVEEE